MLLVTVKYFRRIRLTEYMKFKNSFRNAFAKQKRFFMEILMRVQQYHAYEVENTLADLFKIMNPIDSNTKIDQASNFNV